MSNPVIRPLNALLSGYSFLRSALTGSTKASGLPPAAGVELTNHCNLRCPECNSGSGMMTRKRGFMNISLFEKIIAELNPCLYNLNLYFQGESMMHPQFFEILERCRAVPTTLATNGHFLSAKNSRRITLSGLRKLIVSLDGMDSSVYSSYRQNGDFNRVITGIRNVSGARDKTGSSMKLVIQFLVNSKNEHQIPEARRFACDVNAALYLKSMQIINSDSYDIWLPSADRFRRYSKTTEGYRIRSALPGRCARLWLNPVITWDGRVVPCCFDKNADHVMGDLNSQSFSEVWNSPAYQAFREKLHTGRESIVICSNCTSGLAI